jgi:hypothetical protein
VIATLPGFSFHLPEADTASQEGLAHEASFFFLSVFFLVL